jgi:hypothetical protein
LPDNAHLATDPIPDFTDQTKWAPIGGTPGNVYVYMGPGGSVNLATTDYTDLNFWRPFIVTQLVPQGLNVTNSDSTAAGFIFVLNDVRSDTKAYVTHADHRRRRGCVALEPRSQRLTSTVPFRRHAGDGYEPIVVSSPPAWAAPLPQSTH